ncbi:hypothetical protein ILUMI_01103 [Ignelater luminosus]|uniref:DUF4485 domain-containing protein n=1 Tax=Ignelater luminosus TaxID=2038154 RepID=A0A8K0DEZ7_IGNLU|nr:hypothetical protein ILUMI_01103 [Ignelater luminosus]
MANWACDVEKTLDDEFRSLLRIIKPHIERITDNYYLTFYRMWLEKLSNIGPDQKEERNRYLVELCHQIQDVRLEYPFTQAPLIGPLQPFQYNFLKNKAPNQLFPVKVALKEIDFYNRSPVIIQRSVNASAIHSRDVSGSDTETTVSKETVKDASEAGSCVVKAPSLVIIGTAEALDNSMLKYEYRKQPKHSGDAPRKLCICGPLNKNIESTAVLPKMRNRLYPNPNLTESKTSQKKQAKQQNVGLKRSKQLVSFKDRSAKKSSEKLKSALTNPSIKINVSEKSNSSWFDLTDVSSSSNRSFISVSSRSICEKQCDVMPETNALENLVNAITVLQRQNLELNEDVSNTERQLNLHNVKTEMNIDCLANEVRILKSRLQDLIEIKEAIKSSQKVASCEWKQIINNLKEELQTTQEQNSELQSQVGTLHERLEQLSAENIQFQHNNHLKKNVSNQHQQHIEILKTHHARYMETLENRFMRILNEKESAFGEKLDFLKEIYDRKISEVSNECEKSMENKNAEIQRLETNLRDQCRRMREEVCEIRSQIEANVNNENNTDNVAFLKDCLWKVNRLYKAAEKKYNKQIKKLKKQISLKDRVIKLQLTTQKASIITSISSQTQTEIETTVITLEQKYKQLLENQRMEFLMEKQNDNDLIFELRTLVTSSAANL